MAISEFRPLPISELTAERVAPLIARRVVIPLYDTLYLEISRHGIAFFRGANPDVGGYRLHITYNPNDVAFVRKILLLAVLALQRYERVQPQLSFRHRRGDTYVIDLVSTDLGGDMFG